MTTKKPKTDFINIHKYLTPMTHEPAICVSYSHTGGKYVNDVIARTKP